ncbi:hypothetical protein KSC_086770 [Ktedonobacter sp. SOSP1-52]|uniref:hypothetical protein n=1 Tax=Ktedonobacter sp. SOSP1-52 TaxID=2778366 RepID=UPI0019159FC2|nr:hypothetical protein [Ktedonobacter sp. SOSP1-52]GHO69785.1 hypothetical protein KSC_086770 [Ktedonobacter sp. SOSP1-52]
MYTQEQFEAALVIIEQQMNNARFYPTPSAFASTSLITLVRELATGLFFDGPLTAGQLQRIDAVVENYQQIIAGSFR